jgi:hypothetical protein
MEVATACNTGEIIRPEIKVNSATFVPKVGRPAQISKPESGKIAPKKSGFDLSKLLSSKKFTQKARV